jgi:hypothetical protein
VNPRGFSRAGFPSVAASTASDERRFGRRPATSPSAEAFTAKIVDFIPAGQALGGIALKHDLHHHVLGFSVVCVNQDDDPVRFFARSGSGDRSHETIVAAASWPTSPM